MSTVARIAPLPKPSCVFGEREHVVPQARLAVRLELRQVEVRAAAGVELRAPAVEGVEAKVEQARTHRRTVEQRVLLDEVPPAWTDDERRDLFVQGVALLACVERDRPGDRVQQVALAFDDVLPGRGVRVLEIGHEDARARVEGVDHHLPVDRPRDLDPPLAQVGRRLGDAPLGFAHLARLGEKVRQLAGLQTLPALGPCGEQLAAPRLELALQKADEGKCFRRKDLGRSRNGRASDRDPRRRHSHLSFPSIAAR